MMWKREEELNLRETGAFSGDLGELERKTVKRKRVFATLKVLGTVLQQLTEEIPDELRRVMETDAAMTDDLIACNIIPLDAPSPTNHIGFFLEVISLTVYVSSPKFCCLYHLLE
ncbi:callose synthase 9-like [Humulus lupulus]|uniref:callose synthase 9-like n=1 Tax=Humulus lupulus TaxID=3486 RepID=UPI002B40478F|nr:callose synthase 9-like [Humulus lupulus]